MKTAILCTLFILLSACSSSNFDKINQSNVGFIGDYSKFEKVETSGDLKSFIYASKRVKSGIYSKLIIEPVAFYPEEVTSTQITYKLLQETKAYIDKVLVEAATPYFDIVQEPQEGALVLTPRISTIKTVTGDIEMREMIPIRAAIALTKAAAGYRPQDVEIYMEIKANDSIDGEFVGGSVTQGKGAEISGANAVVTMDNIKPLLDIWIEDASKNLKKLKDFHNLNSD